ncbi:hypothetical protein P4O66_003151 [Electrophorus voltai]|uniref:Uncharacterized protein n=1 Tax=Electrophorus voltai TaxID=2609070 RepID=A0AAD8YTQ7_9TELE|nr:hypothetical protein P4O66_003151 [Electrophorus voltai]
MYPATVRTTAKPISPSFAVGYLQQEGLTDTSRAFIHESPNLREYAEHSSEDGAIPAFRTQNGIQNMRRQRALASSQSPGTAGLTVSTPGHCVGSPVAVPQGMLGHSTPVCYTSQQTRPSTISLSQPGESTLQIIVPDHRIAPGPLSPARRKCDSPRRRGGSQYGPSRGTAVTSSLTVESHSQEAMTENLSGEIHMTDDAIQDILQQTESDPAFQALFDLFDCGKSKMAEGGEPGDGSLSNSAQESDQPGLGESTTDTARFHIRKRNQHKEAEEHEPASDKKQEEVMCSSQRRPAASAYGSQTERNRKRKQANQKGNGQQEPSVIPGSAGSRGRLQLK